MTQRWGCRGNVLFLLASASYAMCRAIALRRWQMSKPLSARPHAVFHRQKNLLGNVSRAQYRQCQTALSKAAASLQTTSMEETIRNMTRRRDAQADFSGRRCRRHRAGIMGHHASRVQAHRHGGEKARQHYFDALSRAPRNRRARRTMRSSIPLRLRRRPEEQIAVIRALIAPDRSPASSSRETPMRSFRRQEGRWIAHQCEFILQRDPKDWPHHASQTPPRRR